MTAQTAATNQGARGNGTAPDPAYPLGRSADERRRLAQQGGLLGPFTRRLLLDAGLVPGMRVLDVGCGAGDVTMLAAELVGPAGAVVGVDRDPTVLDAALARAAEAGLTNVTFREGDFRTLPAGVPFDAVVGRLVLMYQADPAAALRALLPRLRPGGIVVFQEYDCTGTLAVPPGPLALRVPAWLCEAFRRVGVEHQMGPKLYPAFVAAGLPGPQMQLDAIVGGGPDFVGYQMWAAVLRSLLPVLERCGVATAAEVGIDTLADRLRAEVVAGGGCLVGPPVFGACARRP